MVVWVQCADVSGSIIDRSPDFPTGATTGVQPGIVLTPYTGSRNLSSSGIYQNFDMQTDLIVTAPNVTIRNCRITAITTDTFNVINTLEGSSNCIIEYCTITGPGLAGPCSAVVIGGNSSTSDNAMTVRYCNISGGEHAIVLGNGSATIVGNYLHDPNIDPAAVGGDPHVGGVSFKGGQNGVLVQGNRIICGSIGTSDVFIQAQFDAISNVTVNNNCLGTNPGYNLYCEDRFGFTTTNITITNNVLYSGTFGTFSFNITISPQPTIFGNVFLPNRMSDAMYGQGG